MKEIDGKDDTDWLNELGTGVEGKKTEAVSKATPETQRSRNIVLSTSQKIIEDIKKKLMDMDFISSEHLNASTCRRIHDIITILEDSDGVWLEGRKTIDGFVITCPMHGYSAMNSCYKCEFWKGGDNPEGVCIKSLDDVDILTSKKSISQARNEELEYRMEKGAKIVKEKK